MKTKIHFIRHGSVTNPSNILYGRLPDFALSSQGVIEAEKAAARLKNTPLDAIYTSPMLRARQTAEAIQVFHPGILIFSSDELNEVYTPYQGMNAAELRHLHEDFYTGTKAPYEQPADVIVRVELFIRRVRKSQMQHEVVAVTHGDIVSFLVLKKKELDVAPRNKARLSKAGIPDNYPATASITSLTYYTDAEDEIPDVGYTAF